MENQSKPSKLIVEDSLRELAFSFADRFLAIEQKFPKLKLDFTYPSIGVVELALTHLKGINSFSNQEEQLIRGAAAYLTFMTAHAWASIPDELEVRATLASDGGIKIGVTGGIFLPNGSSFSVDVLQAVKETLSGKLTSFFASISRDYSTKDPVIEQFATGLFSGLCPSGIGPWKDLSAKDFAVYLEQLDRFLARTTAQYFGAVYSDNTFDELPEIFGSSLILPPHGFDEPFVGLRASLLVLEHLTKGGYSDKAQLEFARKLGSMPTKQLSTIGHILTFSLSDEVRVGSNIIDPKIRGAVCGIRNRLFGEVDWLTQIEETKADSDKLKDEIQLLFERERSQKLIPAINLPARLLFSERYKPLFKALAWGEMELAEKGCETLLQTSSADDFSILLQQIVLLIELGDLQTAVEKLSLATMVVSSASIDQSVTYFTVAGSLYSQIGEYQNAHDLLRIGNEQGSFQDSDTIPSMLLRSLAFLERFDEAIVLGSTFLERFPFSANIALPICVSALAKEDFELSSELITKVLWNDPCNQSAFWLALRG